MMFWAQPTPSLANYEIRHKTEDGQEGERRSDANTSFCAGGQDVL